MLEDLLRTDGCVQWTDSQDNKLTHFQPTQDTYDELNTVLSSY
jgi:hypothetical protein